MTDGLDVLVQLVIAAITTTPCPTENESPLSATLTVRLAASSSRAKPRSLAGACSAPGAPGDFAPDASENGAGVAEHAFGELRTWLIEELGYTDLPDLVSGVLQSEDDVIYFRLERTIG